MSSSSSEGSPPEKKQKLEGSSSEPPSSEESRFDKPPKGWSPPPYTDMDAETYWKNLFDHGSPVDADDNDGLRKMTDAEYQEYFAALEASGGFDVPSFPDCDIDCGMIIPLEMDEYTREELKPACGAAIKYLYDKENVKYEFRKLEKANSGVAAGINYYLTFEAYNPIKDTTQTFQAIVFTGIPAEEGDDFPYTVYYCEPKNDFGKTGAGRFCGCLAGS